MLLLMMTITEILLLVLLIGFLIDRDCAKLPIALRAIIVLLILLHIFYFEVIFQQYGHYIEREQRDKREKQYPPVIEIEKRDSRHCLFFICEVFIKFL